MKVIDPGHEYALSLLDGDAFPLHRLLFVKREGEGYPGNVGHHPGTTIQEVLRALIDRVKYLDNQIPDKRNKLILRNLRESIYLLESRAADRHGRECAIRDSIPIIETLPTCPKCLHIGCEGKCR